MTELEEQFFKTFGIEPKLLDCNSCGANRVALGLCAEVKCEREYPKITADVLLRLICIYNSQCLDTENLYHPFDVNDIKKEIIDNLLWVEKFGLDKQKEMIKRQVRSLFEEEGC